MVFLCAAGNAEATFILKTQQWSIHMNSVIYMVGLVVVVMAILSFAGLR